MEFTLIKLKDTARVYEGCMSTAEYSQEQWLKISSSFSTQHKTYFLSNICGNLGVGAAVPQVSIVRFNISSDEVIYIG